jgi:dienelactone hydrolase
VSYTKQKPAELHDFVCADFTFGGVTRPVWWSEPSGSSGPVGPGGPRPCGADGAGAGRPDSAVLVCHELPGPSPAFLGFIRHLRDAGFQVAMPHLLGELGRAPDAAHMARGVAHVCLARTFHLLARDAESPIASWLRALATAMAGRFGVARVGAVGMCLTGNFALGLLLNPVVSRAVACQPSLPLTISPAHAAALHLAPADVSRIGARLADPADPAAAMALRFEGDPLCPAPRFEALRRTFPDGLTLLELPPERRRAPHPARPGALRPPRPFAHATLTLDLDPTPGSPTFEARARVVAFLREGLAEDGAINH